MSATAHPTCAAASACSSSVWPGNGTPAAANASLCSGAVTSAAISPCSAARAAQTTQSAAIRPGLRADPAKRLQPIRGHGRPHLQQREAARRQCMHVLRRIDPHDRQARAMTADEPDRPAQMREIAGDEAAAHPIRRFEPAPGDDLRADAGRVAHRDRHEASRAAALGVVSEVSRHRRVQAGLSISMNRWARPCCAAMCAATAGAP